MKQKRLMIRTIVLLIIVAALGYTFYTNFFSETKELVNVGDEAPNFVLTDLDGNRVELADLKGQGVFLNFWGTYCPPCEKEMPYMEKLYQIYKDQGVEILAVNVDEPRLTVERFVQRHKLTFPILMDEGLNVINAYGVSPLPTTFLIDKDGMVVGRILGGMNEESIEEYMQSIKP
ncbi:thiol-disulfide oxidoreductase ResA [Anaerobacillus sp. MEB173]|uniref:thiol-disulfide oxidoreductase ResA n=1 Tax=Anaerobacillus sp. MEB173 TaxID=3383345 RepID=UPI003F909B3A